MDIIGLSKKVGLQLLRERAWQQLWLDKEFFCLVCDLTKLPPAPQAKVPTVMQPFDLASFAGFEEEFALVEGADAVEVYARENLRQAKVQTAYLARDPQGAPMYVHWLITPGTQNGLHLFQPDRYRHLGVDEGLIEGAYTFSKFRGLGLMAASQHQLLERARAQGLKRVWTYVAVDNVPSLKGCARVGFVPDHVRHNQRRFGSMRTEFTPLTQNVTSLWDRSVAQRAA
jgi:RimJ/RimL family protein N-acetyltransferase